MDQLDRETEPAMALHLACIILFQYHTNTLLHAPGRCVPQIIAYLESNLTPSDFQTLNNYQALVIEQLYRKPPSRSTSESEESTELLTESEMSKSPGILLSEGIADVKSIVKNMKKTSNEV